MQEQRRQPEGRDVHGPARGGFSGDFPDWDNPEDAEEAPPGYYDDEEDDSYVPDEGDPDYDLSEAAGYGDWDPGRPSIVPSWLIIAVSLLLILAILFPLLLIR